MRSHMVGTKISLLVFFSVFIFSWPVRPVLAQEFFHQDLEHRSSGLYTKQQLQEDWGNPTWNDGVDEGRVRIVGDNEEKMLQVDYPKGEFGTKKTGVQWKTPLPAREELTLSYRLKFSDGFDFVKGGKLPGLAGGIANTGAQKPNGSDGFSARIMWRRDGGIVQYVYHPDQPEDFGEDFSWNHGGVERRFQPGIWYEVKTRIVMNTPGQRNGILQSWLNGELALDVKTLRLRDRSDLSIDVLYFSTFFGGSDSSWASKGGKIFFDDVVVVSREQQQVEKRQEKALERLQRRIDRAQQRYDRSCTPDSKIKKCRRLQEDILRYTIRRYR